MALDNIPTLGPGGFNGNLDKVLVHKNGGSEVACSLLTLTNSALNIAGVYLDTVNQRVGINNPNPVTALDVIGAGRFYQTFGIGVPSLFAYNGRAEADSTLRLDNPGGGKLYFGGFGLLNETNAAFGQLSAPSARVGIKGSGSTSATTSLLVQNSGGTAAMTVKDDLSTTFGGAISNTSSATFGIIFSNQGCLAKINSSGNAYTVMETSNTTGAARFYQYVSIGKTTDPVASAALEVVSATRGFLPPVMTTAQKNVIATPAAGLMVYDTDLNRPCFHNGSAWVTL